MIKSFIDTIGGCDALRLAIGSCDSAGAVLQQSQFLSGVDSSSCTEGADIGVIIGAVVGGVGVAALMGLIAFFWMKAKKSKVVQVSASTSATSASAPAVQVIASTSAASAS